MPDTGLPYNIPFLDGTELVRDYPDFSEDLADAIVDGLDAAGVVKQVVSTTKTDTFSSSSNTLTEVTGLTVSITPTSATSKVLVIATVSVGSNPSATSVASVLRRGTTILSRGDADGSRNRSFSAGTNFRDNYINDHVLVELDAPNSTSALVYNVAVTNAEQNSSTVHVNRGNGDGNNTFIWRTASTITAIEVAA